MTAPAIAPGDVLRLDVSSIALVEVDPAGADEVESGLESDALDEVEAGGLAVTSCGSWSALFLHDAVGASVRGALAARCK